MFVLLEINMKFYCLLLTLILLSNIFYGQETLVKKQFLIAGSTKDYSNALKIAESIADDLKLKLDLRGLYYDESFGLTFKKSVCEEDGGNFPCYQARGRYDNGSYISIEMSDSYQGFSKGYYIVIIASYSDNKEEIEALLKNTKEYIPDAYIKSSNVYVGCMH